MTQSISLCMDHTQSPSSRAKCEMEVEPTTMGTTKSPTIAEALESIKAIANALESTKVAKKDLESSLVAKEDLKEEKSATKERDMDEAKNRLESVTHDMDTKGPSI